MRWARAVVIVGVVSVLAGCGAAAGSKPASVRIPVRAGHESVRFTLTSERDHGAGSVTRVSGEGSIDAAGNWLMVTSQPTVEGGPTLEAASVWVDGHGYTRYGPTGKWIALPEVSADLRSLMPDATDPTGILASLPEFGDVRRMGAEELDGVPTTHYSVTLDAQKLLRRASARIREMVDTWSQSPSEDPGTVDVWVDADGRARQLVQRSSSPEGGDATVTFRFHDFGADVEVPRPAPDEITDTPVVPPPTDPPATTG